MTLHAQILRARDRLVAAGLTPADAEFDARLLARHVLGWDTARLLVDQREPPPSDFDGRYERVVARRERREPVAHITGVREFWGLPFEVSPDVLVPRPETELLVEEAVTALRNSIAWGSPEHAFVIDVGTGSGCLAVALAREMPGARVIGTDVSAAALAVARRNAARHVPDGRVHFVRTDLLAGLQGHADVIVSNPPYIPDDEAAALAPEVRDREPTHRAVRRRGRPGRHPPAAASGTGSAAAGRAAAVRVRVRSGGGRRGVDLGAGPLHNHRHQARPPGHPPHRRRPRRRPDRADSGPRP